MIETKTIEFANWPIAPVKDPLDDFFEKLSQTPRDWEVTKAGHIRRMIGAATVDCPISAVTGDHNDFGNPIPAAKRIGLSHGDAVQVFNAADGAGTYRARLLEACGTEERHEN